LAGQGALSAFLIVLLFVMAVAVIAFIVFIERSLRKLLIQYPKRQHGKRYLAAKPSICR
jgi:preprotein translocase subunit SecY